MAFRKFLIFLIPAFFSCAYFNTFYNAKTYFREAEKIYRVQGESSRELSSKYNKVIEKCAKIFEFYKNSSYVDDALYLTAISYKRIGDLTKSRIKFEELYRFFPNSPYCIKALPEYADLLVTLGEFDDLKFLLRKYPEAINKPEFLLVRVKMLFVEGDYRGIVSLVEEKWKDVSKFPGKKELLKLAIESASKIQDYDAAERFLRYSEALVISENERLLVLLSRVNILTAKKDYEKAIEVLEKAPFQQESEQFRVIQYEKARIYTQLNSFDKALELIQAVLEKPRRDSIYYKAYFLKGKIMESIDSLNVAVSIYQDLRNYPLPPGLKSEVDMRYNTLLEVSSVKEGDDYAMLRKAELYFMDLNNFEKAVEIYKAVLSSSKNQDVIARALYALTIIHRYYLNNEEAAEYFEERLVTEFPESYQSFKILERKNLNLKQ
ncbi:MAG: tetratricopeptide repeat protein [candidate division WOR-3 bacterium]